MDAIYFKDQEDPKFKMLVGAAIGALLLAIVFFVLDFPSVIALATAGVSVALFAFTSIDNFKHTNLVQYDSNAVTVKLLGRRTFGFRFSNVEHLDLSEKGLLIRLKEMDAITLSRKRYSEQSLQKFYNLIVKNK